MIFEDFVSVLQCAEEVILTAIETQVIDNVRKSVACLSALSLYDILICINTWAGHHQLMLFAPLNLLATNRGSI